MNERPQSWRIPALALAAIALCALPSAGFAAAQPAHLFKIATIAPQGSTWMNLMDELDKRVREETSGEVGFRFYPGGQQGSDLDVLRKIRSGQLQGGGIAGVGLGEINSAIRIFELPFMFRTAEELDVAHRELDPALDQGLRERGFQLLGWADIGFVYLFSQNAVRNAADLRSQKVWLWEGDELARTLLQEAGVSPVALNITDVLTSLQTGMVNTVYVTPYACLSLQWFTRLKYMTDIPITYSIGAVVLDAKAYDQLTDAEKQTVMRIAGEIFPRLNQATRQQNDESKTALVGNGMQLVSPDPAAVEEFRQIGTRTWQALAGKMYPQELLDRLLAALEQTRGGQDRAR